MACARAIAALSLLGCGSPMMPPPPACDMLCAPPSWSELALVAGQPGGPGFVDGPRASAHLADPWALASDGATLWLIDGQAVRAIDPASGAVSTLAGAFQLTGGDDGVGAQARFYSPQGIAFALGQLYVADTENHQIRRIDPASGAVSTVAGQYGTPGTSDGTGPAALFREPEGMAFDGAGTIYLADTDNNTIRAMTVPGLVVTTIAGTAGTAGMADGVGAAASFAKPKAMSWDGAGAIYVIDSSNQLVRKVAVPGGTVTTIGTFAVAPNGIAFAAGGVLVSLADHTVVRIDPATGAQSLLAGAANTPGFTDGAGAQARLSRPAGMRWNDQSTVWLADGGNYALRTLDPTSGAVATIDGAKSAGSADGAGASARFWSPQGLCAAQDGTLYVADTNNATVRRVDPSGAVTTLAGAAGQTGSADGAGASARFNQPAAVAVDESGGALWVADAGNRALRRIDLAGGQVSTAAIVPAAQEGVSRFLAPAGLAIDGGVLYVTDHDSQIVAAIDLATLTARLLAGSPTLPGTADGTGSEARFFSPTGIAADHRGALFVADVQNNVVREIDIANRAVTTVADTHFSYPTQVAVDGAGDLFVADSLHNVVAWVKLATGEVTVAVGSLTLSGVALGPLPAQITAPSALALTPSDQLALFSEDSLLVAR